MLYLIVILTGGFAEAPCACWSARGAYRPSHRPKIQALALNGMGLVEEGYGVALVFFGAQCLVTGYLIYRSSFLPRV